MIEKSWPVVLITGSTRGIGRASAEWFLQNGWQVILHGTDDKSVQNERDQLSDQFPNRVSGFACDLNNEGSVNQLFRYVKEETGRLNSLILNAGFFHATPLSLTSSELVDKFLNVNIKSNFLCIQQASRLLRRSSNSSIVVMGSVMGERGLKNAVMYSTTKAALHGMVRASCMELAEINIRINAVLPGFVHTDMSSDLSESERAAIENEIALHRFANTSEVAEVIGFLADDRSSYVTGSLITVDGGFR